MPALSLSSIVIHCGARCSRCARGYRCCSPWTHSYRCRHSTLPCLRFHRPSTSPEHKILPRSKFKARFCRKIFDTRSNMKSSRPKCAAETCPASRILRHTLAILPHIGRVRPAYSAKSKKRFSKRLFRAVGGSSQTGPRLRLVLRKWLFYSHLIFSP